MTCVQVSEMDFQVVYPLACGLGHVVKVLYGHG